MILGEEDARELSRMVDVPEGKERCRDWAKVSRCTHSITGNATTRLLVGHVDNYVPAEKVILVYVPN